MAFALSVSMFSILTPYFLHSLCSRGKSLSIREITGEEPK